MNAAGMIVRVGDAVSRRVVAVYADGAEAEGVRRILAAMESAE